MPVRVGKSTKCQAPPPPTCSGTGTLVVTAPSNSSRCAGPHTSPARSLNCTRLRLCPTLQASCKYGGLSVRPLPSAQALAPPSLPALACNRPAVELADGVSVPQGGLLAWLFHWLRSST